MSSRLQPRARARIAVATAISPKRSSPVDVPGPKGTTVTVDRTKARAPGFRWRSSAKLAGAFRQRRRRDAGQRERHHRWRGRGRVDDGQTSQSRRPRRGSAASSARASSASIPTSWASARPLSIPKALQQAGIGEKDLAVMEINEAFAPQVLACLKEMGVQRTACGSIRTAARFRSDIRSAHRARASRSRRCTTCATRRRIRHCVRVHRRRPRHRRSFYHRLVGRDGCRANARSRGEGSGMSPRCSSSRSCCGRSLSRRVRFGPQIRHNPRRTRLYASERKRLSRNRRARASFVPGLLCDVVRAVQGRAAARRVVGEGASGSRRRAGRRRRTARRGRRLRTQVRLSDVALDPHADAQGIFSIAGFPTVVVIDPQGRIRAKWEGLNPAIAMAMTNAENTLAAPR